MEILNTIQTQTKNITAPGSTLWEQPSSVAEIKLLLEDSNDYKVLDGLRKLMAVPLPFSCPDSHFRPSCPPSLFSCLHSVCSSSILSYFIFLYHSCVMWASSIFLWKIPSHYLSNPLFLLALPPQTPSIFSDIVILLTLF